MTQTATAPPTDTRRPPWAARAVVAPFRYAVRHPGRFLLRLTFFLLLVVAATYGAVAYWFSVQLGHARRHADLCHNFVAGEYLDRCRRVWPHDRTVLLLGARIARRSGAWADAEQDLTAYADRHGEDDALVLERLLYRAAKGELVSAEGPLLARIDADGPDAAPAREALVEGYMYNFRRREAAVLLEAWLTRSPDDPVAHLFQGKLQEQRDDLPAAIASFTNVVQSDPDQYDARLRLSTLLVRRNLAEQALPHVDFLRDRLPNHPDVRIQKVQVANLLGRRDEARSLLDESLRLSPDHAMTALEKGRFVLADGDDRGAEVWLQKASRLDPGYIPARHEYAQLLARLGKAKEAAAEQAAVEKLNADYKRIQELTEGTLPSVPFDPAVHHEIGMISLRVGQTPEAVRWFQNALRLDPDHLPTHKALSYLYHETGNAVLAAKHRALAKKLAPVQP